MHLPKAHERRAGLRRSRHTSFFSLLSLSPGTRDKTRGSIPRGLLHVVGGSFNFFSLLMGAPLLLIVTPCPWLVLPLEIWGSEHVSQEAIRYEFGEGQC